MTFSDSDHKYFTSYSHEKRYFHVVSHLHFSWNKLANHKGIHKHLILMYSGHTHTLRPQPTHTSTSCGGGAGKKNTHIHTHTHASHQQDQGQLPASIFIIFMFPDLLLPSWRQWSKPSPPCNASTLHTHTHTLKTHMLLYTQQPDNWDQLLQGASSLNPQPRCCCCCTCLSGRKLCLGPPHTHPHALSFLFPCSHPLILGCLWVLLPSVVLTDRCEVSSSVFAGARLELKLISVYLQEEAGILISCLVCIQGPTITHRCLKKSLAAISGPRQEHCTQMQPMN